MQDNAPVQSVICGRPGDVASVFGEGRRERIAALTRLHPVTVHSENLDEQRDALRDVEVIFGTWGFPSALVEHLDELPKLRAVFYAASSVQRFARPLLERDILLCSAWQANARFVARMTLGLVLLGCKGYFQNARDWRGGMDRASVFTGPGAFDATVAVLGVGAAGRCIIELLKPFDFKLLACDPFLPDDAAERIGVRKVELDEAFERALVVTNHVADKPATRGLIGMNQFQRMPANATFINTGRSSTVNHAGLVEVLKARPDLTALLDVIEGLPDDQDRAIRQLPNAWVTSHIAGAINRERLAIGDAVIDQFQQWQASAEPTGRVTESMLEAMA